MLPEPIMPTTAKRSRSIWRRLRKLFAPDPDRFLRQVSGVVHVGANTGQERNKYAKFNLDVLWVEPIPEVFATLQENLRAYPRQRAVQALVTDTTGKQEILQVSNNSGLSSSILDLKEHKDIWPAVAYTRALPLTSVTLTELIAREGLDASSYQALVMDTQGTELLVLRGGLPLLEGFRYIKTEVPDFEAYAGCCLLRDIEAFMLEHGFVEIARDKFAERAQGGAYYDVVYEKTRP
jgi:FkbM family methyltransferase